jgi:WD40 repeat protein
MKVDAKRRHLWVTTAAIPQMMNYKEEESGRSAIFKFDLVTGKLLKKYTLPGKPEKHLLGDLVVNSRGDVFATDSQTPTLYMIDRRKDELEVFMSGEPFVSAQGLDFSEDEKQLFVADYSRGIFVIELATKKHFNLKPALGSTLLGIDGLYFYRHSLIATQNGTNPNRIVRLHLDRGGRTVERLEILEANNPLFDEPTLGVRVRDTFYYVANSQWGAVNDKGQLAPAEKLRDPIILKVKL